MNGQRFHQQKRTEMKTEQCERSLNGMLISSEKGKGKRSLCAIHGFVVIYF